MKTPSKRKFYQLVEHKLYAVTRTFARTNRHCPTDAEDILWQQLRNSKLDGFKFRRQHPTGPYVVDFLCFSAKLIVEVDGDIHSEGNHPKRDARRTRDLEGLGFEIVRFTNEQVLNQTPWVLGEICKALNRRTTGSVSS